MDTFKVHAFLTNGGGYFIIYADDWATAVELAERMGFHDGNSWVEEIA